MSAFLTGEMPPRGIKNAHLIVCPKEGELLAAASAFLTRLFCENKRACGACAHCRRALSGAHPDVFFIRPSGASVKVDEVRRVLSFIADKPFEDGYKAVVIEQAERMTPEAQNALLKPIEEPPANTVFLLLARSESTVLPTVASRCARLRLRPVPAGALQKILLDETGAPEEKARLVCALSDGYAHEARRLLRDDAFLALREQTIGMCAGLCAAKHMGIQKHADFLEANKNVSAVVLDVMLSFFFDLLHFRLTGSPERVKNTDRLRDIEEFSVRFTRAGLRTMIDCICETQKRLRFPLNFRLAAENMLLGILEGKQHGESDRRAL